MIKSYVIEMITVGTEPESIKIELHDLLIKKEIESNENMASMLKQYRMAGLRVSTEGILNIELDAQQKYELKPFVGMCVDMELRVREGFGT